jgi:hypothetical protein
MSWLAILKHAPVLLSAAEALFHTESSRASAELIQQMAAQLQALAMSQQNAARQLRIAIGISVAATVIAVAAVVVAFVR